MKKLFGLFVISILSSTAMAELICLSPVGCAIDIETGACPTCIEKFEPIVEPIVEPTVELAVNVKSTTVSASSNSCPNYFELHHGGKTCEIQRNRCGSSKRLCNKDFRGCKRVESSYNKRFERNHGKRTCE